MTMACRDSLKELLLTQEKGEAGELYTQQTNVC